MRVKQAASFSTEDVIEGTEKTMMMMVVKKKVCGGDQVGTYQESGGSSSEEMDSPRSVFPKTLIGRNYTYRWSSISCGTTTTGKTIGDGLYLHSQILKIRDEESRIGEDINAEVLNLCVANKHGLASLTLLSRPVLPASPLAGKTTAVEAAD